MNFNNVFNSLLFDSRMDKALAYAGEFFEMVDSQLVVPPDASLLDSSEASDQETGEAKTSKSEEKVKGPPEPFEAMEVDRRR